MKARRVRFDRDLLKRLRIGNGMTLREMSELAGVSNPYLSQLENGRTDDPGIEALTRIADVFKLSVETFIVRVTPLAGTGRKR